MSRVAVLQMQSGEKIADNFSQLECLIVRAVEQGAELVLLPENFALLDSAALITLAEEERNSSQVFTRLQQLAVDNQVWIVAGSFPCLAEPVIGQPQKVYSRCLVINAEGLLIAHYDKVHLFDVDVADSHARYRESDFIKAGVAPVVVETPFGMLGLSICYDLRFPEHYQRLTAMGAEILLVPSAFTSVTGAAHWEPLLRARAIENQCYLLAANQAGQHTPSRSSWGHSMIVDPWGTILAECDGHEPDVIVVDIDLYEVRNRRQSMPITQHKAKAGF